MINSLKDAIEVGKAKKACREKKKKAVEEKTLLETNAQVVRDAASIVKALGNGHDLFALIRDAVADGKTQLSLYWANEFCVRYGSPNPELAVAIRHFGPWAYYDNGDIYDAEGNGPKPGPDCVVVSWEKQEAAVPDPNKGPQSGDRVWGQRYNENEVEDWPIIDEVTPGPGPAYLVSLTEWKHCIWVEWDGKWWKEVVPL